MLRLGVSAEPTVQLLNTFTNLGGTWPRYFVLKGVDYFTQATCRVGEPDNLTVLEGKHSPPSSSMAKY